MVDIQAPEVGLLRKELAELAYSPSSLSHDGLHARCGFAEGMEGFICAREVGHVDVATKEVVEVPHGCRLEACRARFL